jgi:O-antigen/teichoic acid export membrane protein
VLILPRHVIPSSMFFTFLTQRLGRALGIRPAALRVVETIANSILIVLVSVFTGVISARLLGPTGRGELASILLGLQIASLLAIVGLPNSSIYHIKKDPGHKSQIVGGAFALAGLFGLVAGVIAWIAIPHWLEDYSSKIVTAAQVTVLLSPLWALYQVATPVLRARDEFLIFNTVRLLPPLLTLLSLVLIALSELRSPIAISLTYSLSYCAILAWPVLWIWRDCHPRLRGSSRQIRQLLRYSARSLAVDVANTLSLYVDRILLVYLLAPSAVGLYVVAVNMAHPLREIGWAIALVLFPKAAEYEREAAIAVSGLAARAGLLVMTAAGMPLVIVAPMFLSVLFGEEFLPAAPVFRVLVIASILSSTADITAQAFMATGRPGIVSILRSIELAMLLALLAYLVPHFGLMGAAWAILAAAGVRLFSILACYPLVLGKAPPRLYLSRSDIRRIRGARGGTPAQP